MYPICGRHHEGEGHEGIWHHEGEGHDMYGTMSGEGHEGVWHHEGEGHEGV